MTQEPVMWVMPDGKTVDKWGLQFYGGQTGTPLYTQSLSDKPYGYVRKDGGGMFVYGEHQVQNTFGYELVPIYLRPQREWVGLTDEQIEELANPLLRNVGNATVLASYEYFARAIEAKLRERNT